MAQVHATFELLEEIEALEMGLVEELESIQRKTHRSKLAQECRIANSLHAAQSRAKKLKFDANMQPQGGFAEFLVRKQALRPLAEDEEREEPRTIARIASWGGREIPCNTEEEARLIFRPKNRAERRLARSKIDSFVIEQTCNFTGEEMLGRFLDLHAFHFEFQNLHDTLRGVSYLDYLRKYISVLPPPNVSTQQQHSQYASYVKRLGTHLLDFEMRARPLTVQEKPTLNFSQELDEAQSVQDIEAKLGMDELKLALADRGLKVGGTKRQRAERLWRIKGLSLEDFPSELKASTTTVGDLEREERTVKQTLNRLQTIVSATVTMITKKLTMTYEEIEQEAREAMLEEAERSDAEEEDDDKEQEETFQQHGKIDPSTGRLIPKWMYRLHGLNQEFRCEICGNHAYFGRRAYERHFKDFRHANGMKALGIPNTAHFLDITKIADALSLHQSLKLDMERNEFHRQTEEFEDAEGNVMNRRTYEDLKREGLL